jgi:tetratricopeptide (TPR) repeat protein
MASIIPGYVYDIFISYRQKDNKYDGWVTEFVDNLNRELGATFKEEIGVYFDISHHDGLLETHDVDASLKEKLKCLIFIPVISRTYCDPKSFAWEHEFKAFIEQATCDQFGLKITLPNGNVANRVLPVRIHEPDISDVKLCESVLGGPLRSVDFIYKSPGVNRPLRAGEDHPQDNLYKVYYRDQINKVANAIDEIIGSLKRIDEQQGKENWSLKDSAVGTNEAFHFNRTRKENSGPLVPQGKIQSKASGRLVISGKNQFKNFSKYIYSVLFIVTMVVLTFGWRGHLNFPGVGKSKREQAKTFVAEAIKHFDNKDYESAKTMVDRALAIDPKYSWAWSTLAAVSVKKGNVNDAILQTIEAVKLDPTNVTAAYNMAIALDDKKDYHQAIEWYTKALKMDSTFVPAYSALGRLYNLLNQPVDAILVLSKALDKYPESQYIYLIYKNIGNSHLLMNQYEEAVEALERSRQLKPSETETCLFLAKAYEASGKLGRSIEIWQDYIDRETDTVKSAEAKKHLKEITIKHLQEIIK